MAKRRVVKQNRRFQGVWIPAELWLDENLQMPEILMLIEIQSLDRAKGCTASNKYFADFFGKTPQRVSQIIKSLEKKGYISIKYDRCGKECKGRKITVSNKFDRYQENLQRYQENLQGYQEKFKANNTNNNTDNNTDKILSSSHSTSAHEIVDYLNSKIGTHYRATTRKTQSLIKARMNEGFTVDDFKKVIDNKVAEWDKDSKMSKYLRPETLFGTKFESYLNQAAVKTKKSKRINTLPF